MENDAITLNVPVGEYTVQLRASGRLHVNRHGKEWRDCTGDGLVCALAHEIDRLRKIEGYRAEDKIAFDGVREQNAKLREALRGIGAIDATRAAINGAAYKMHEIAREALGEA